MPAEATGHEGHRQRLRQRYAAAGVKALADYEMVELILTYCIPRIDVKPIAKDLILRFGNLRSILDANAEDLKKTKGIGDSAAIAIKLIKDAMNVYLEEELATPSQAIPSISKLMNYFKGRLAHLQHEAFEVACFDIYLRLIPNGTIRMAEGNVTTLTVNIRKLIETAIGKGAASIAVAHNHPAGTAEPSVEDIRLTKKISEACRPISLNFIEHIIVGKNSCFSFRHGGYFDALYDNSLEDERIDDDIKPEKRKRKVS